MYFPKVIGAFDRKNVYTLPHEAKRGKKYSCVGNCGGKMILYKSHLDNYYFRHDNETINICKFYNKHPNESSDHTHAKYYLKWILDNKRVSVNGRIFDLHQMSDWKCVVEKSFVNNKKRGIVDVAIVLNDKILFAFEIFKTHDTDLSTRPFPTLQLTDMIVDDISFDNSTVYFH
jgi:hypothetical protein